MAGAATDLERVAPFFQPVVAVDEREVAGYEVLARELHPTGPASLGPFFRDPAVSRERRLQVDDWVLTRALDRFRRQAGSAWLFVNLPPERLAPLPGDPPDPAERVRRAGIPTGRVVLEVGEVVTTGSREAEARLGRLRQEGFRLAVDDVGAALLSLPRLAELAPDFIKVDRSLVGPAPGNLSYRAAVESFARLADRIGADLVLEGVETEAQLVLAVEVGARYVQGYRFAPALAELVNPHRFSAAMARGVETARRRRWRALERRQTLGHEVAARLDAWWEQAPARRRWPPPPDDRPAYDAVARTALTLLPGCCLHTFVCDSRGWQLSADWERHRHRVLPGGRPGRVNWSARPYFLANLATAATGVPQLSEPYADRRSHRAVVTLTYPLGADRYLLVDIDWALAYAGGGEEN
ncbi:MAG: EAL domain-containing protein [Firmicutes bacterium]|nr:EAL domain-containing protein [Bacillota bacterium]